MILSVKTRKRTELIDITPDINQLLQKTGICTFIDGYRGRCVRYIYHAKSLIDPSLLDDLIDICSNINQFCPFPSFNRYNHGCLH